MANVGYTLEPDRPQPFYASSVVAFGLPSTYSIAAFGLLLQCDMLSLPVPDPTVALSLCHQRCIQSDAPIEHEAASAFTR